MPAIGVAAYAQAVQVRAEGVEVVRAEGNVALQGIITRSGHGQSLLMQSNKGQATIGRRTFSMGLMTRPFRTCAVKSRSAKWN